jgi:cytochrome b
MAQQMIRVWDWPVRITHWSFALLIPAMWWTAENGEMGWHMRLGLLLLGLVIFRILWGFLGSSTARFGDFLRGPVTVLRYVSGQGQNSGSPHGHSPIGGWSVVVLLGAMLAQASFGLFAGDPFDGATGPLNAMVGVLTADMLTDWHESFFWWLVGLVGVHLSAILLYHVIGGQDLVRPMITGKRVVDKPEGALIDAPWWRLAICLAITGLIVLSIATYD